MAKAEVGQVAQERQRGARPWRLGRRVRGPNRARVVYSRRKDFEQSIPTKILRETEKMRIL